jgi:hypothetical protein
MKFLSFIFLLFSPLILLSQSGRVEGKVTDAATGKPLPGASVLVFGEKKGTSTNMDGIFTLSLESSKSYTLQISSVNYKKKEITDVTVTPGAVSYINITLEVAAKSEGEVVVKSSSRKESVNAMINYQRTAPVVAQVVSAEAIRRSPDKNTGEVLKRVPGASIQEGKFLVVRGLADRYNQSMLNGILLSSTEPDRKTFSFDILPSSMIDNIIINKAFIPELPGEWAGGLIQVNTKDVPAKDFFSLQLGTGFNTQTIGHEFYSYQGSKTDFLGFDNGFRALPDGLPTKSVFESLSAGEKAAWGQKFKNIWTADEDITGASLLSQTIQLSGGFTRNLGERSKLGAILSAYYNRSPRRIEFHNRILRFQNNVPDLYFDYNNTKYNTEILAGALANLTLQIRNYSKISWKTILNVNTSDYSTLRNGLDYEGRIAGVTDEISATELAFKENAFFNTQLTGEHQIKKYGLKVNWYGSFNILDQYIPDQRRVQYVKEDPTVRNSPFVIFIPVSNASQKNGSRYYGFLNDYNYTTGGDLSKTFIHKDLSHTIKAGYFFQVKDRLFDSRPFTVYLPSGNPAFMHLPQSQVFAPENFGDGTDDKLYFNEISGSNYRYVANSILNAGFLQFDNNITSKLRAVWGLRVEDFDQVVGSLRKEDPRHVHSRVTDFLPAVNISYKINMQSVFRLAGSQTVVRPEFRELSTFQFYDFEMGATIAGNPGLVRTKITNYDLRWELYPATGELFTVGFFYKYFKNPLEVYFNPASGEGSTYNLLNAEEANAFGTEFEFRKKLTFSEALRNFTLHGNFSYIYNRVKSLDRPMQGQSPYLLNAGIQYDLDKQGIRTTLLFNQIGRRVALVGGSDQPPIWENPRAVVDLQISKKIMSEKGEIKLNVSDLLNQQLIFYWDVDDNGKYNSSIDAYALKRKFGTNLNLSFSYNF